MRRYGSWWLMTARTVAYPHHGIIPPPLKWPTQWHRLQFTARWVQILVRPPWRGRYRPTKGNCWYVCLDVSSSVIFSIARTGEAKQQSNSIQVNCTFELHHSDCIEFHGNRKPRQKSQPHPHNQINFIAPHDLMCKSFRPASRYVPTRAYLTSTNAC